MEHKPDAEIIAAISRPQMEPVTFAEVEKACNAIIAGDTAPVKIVPAKPRHVQKYLWAAVIAVFAVKYIDIPQAAPNIRTYSTATAQRARVTLPDGSVALLAPNTK